MVFGTQIDSNKIAVSTPEQLSGVLSDCSDRRQPVVTVSSDLLCTFDGGRVTTALRLDLAAMSSVTVDADRRIALAGPGSRLSQLLFEAQKRGMMPELEPLLGLDFTLGDWAHEPLRMLSTSNSGIDGVLRNVKAVAPRTPFQTGFDTTPANGGGYDLTKLYISSCATLGAPYQFTLSLRPIPEKTVEKTYLFGGCEQAVKAGIAMHSTGLPKLLRAESAGMSGLLVGERERSGHTSGCHLTVRLEGSPKPIESSEKALDELAKREGGDAQGSATELKSRSLIDTASLRVGIRPMGVMVVDSLSLSRVIAALSEMASKKAVQMHYSVADLARSASVLVPVIADDADPELVRRMGVYLVNERVSLRGNRGWNPLPGDSGAVPRLEIVMGIKRFLDPHMILNPHAMGGW